ncbi:MAG: histidine kinase [Candidatus Wallbacteria bacterium HGW-Wallbacteria-1]|jgi:acetoin utilization protein AcuB|uniref:Hut operon positive regulatory protein n=1 Tax=Candidatus Wallbacteria bacterium HGW-Wallbacteria-1 TaxID=2013854 RepID=A0A2N1PSX8_9BACT|nr:MAG: histidine kinase [Candidatus Wallbacteria bacterium HGW-Wallbacteria-1]
MSLLVEQVMTKTVTQVEPGDSVLIAKRKMILEPLDAVIVTSDKRVVGIATKSDLVKALRDDQPISEIMTENVLTIISTATIQEAAKVLTANSINSLPVVDEMGKMAGIVALKDIVKDFVKEQELSTLSMERLCVLLAMTESREREDYWLKKCDERDYHAVITQVGTSAEKLPIKLRESIIVAAIAKGVISAETHEKQAVSNAVRDAYLQLNMLNPGLGGGFKISAVRGERRIAVCLYGRCGHALANSPEQVFLGISII